MLIECRLQGAKPAADLHLPLPADVALISENYKPVPEWKQL